MYSFCVNIKNTPLQLMSFMHRSGFVNRHAFIWAGNDTIGFGKQIRMCHDKVETFWRWTLEEQRKNKYFNDKMLDNLNCKILNVHSKKATKGIKNIHRSNSIELCPWFQSSAIASFWAHFQDSRLIYYQYIECLFLSKL